MKKESKIIICRNIFLATPQSLGFLLLGYTPSFVFMCYFYVLFAVSGGCFEKCSLGQGLINSGDIYKYSHPHIRIYYK